MSILKKLLASGGFSAPSLGQQEDVAFAPSFGSDDSPSAATKEDIYYCFRLLLGRNPNPEEWLGHSARAGEPLTTIVPTYLRSQEFAQRNLLVADSLSDVTLGKVDGVSLWASPNDLDVGRHVLQGNYEPEVSAFIRSKLSEGMGFLDVGANIGYFTMVAAAQIGPNGFVMAVEPNDNNTKLIEASRMTNKFAHVRIAQCAAGRTTGLLALHAAQSNGSTSIVPKEVGALLNARVVPQFRLDDIVPKGQRIDCIKIDVEGAEYNALLGAERLIETWRPNIVSEFSPTRLPGTSGIDGPGYLNWLMTKGYLIGALGQAGRGATEPAQDVGAIMRSFEERGQDHIDIVAVPG